MSATEQFDLAARNHIREATRDLEEEFRGIWTPETIDRYVEESIGDLGHVNVQQYIHIFVSRHTRERLRAMAQAEGRMAKAVPEVLFVCVHNAGRSQMAAGLLDKLGGGRVHVRSCGSEPSDQINPAVVEAMSEVGVDVSKEYPKPLNDDFVQAADVVITMGCGDACPIYPGKRYEDWELDDPAGQGVEQVREIRDEIEGRVRELLDELAEA